VPATEYKLWAPIKDEDRVGRGATRPIHVGVAGIAKSSSQKRPFIVANELICFNLGRAILLPMPPGFITKSNGIPHYTSLNFSLSGDQLPPVDPEIVVRDCPNIVGGILAFDIWIVNSDRHTTNLAHDEDSHKVVVFDHSHAFFHGYDAQVARNSLQQKQDQLGIGGHCLAQELLDPITIKQWITKICQIPEFYITGVMKAATEVGLPDSDIQFCVDYLSDRRQRLEDLIRANRGVFPKVPATLWNQF